MKKMNSLSLGLTFCGCFLGAGYVSGQEIWQFFGCFGVSGVWGLVLAILIQLFCGIVLLKLSYDTGIEELDLVIIRRDIPALRMLVGAVQVFFLFGICVIMFAGAGALLEQIFGISPTIGSAIIAVLVTIISFYSFRGLVSALEILVPFLVAASLIFSVIALKEYGFSGFLPIEPAAETAFGGWFFSALTFVSYNMFCSIGILTPLSRELKSRKVIPIGVAIGCFGLFAIAFSVIVALTAFPSSLAYELPMLNLAQEINFSAGIIFAVLLAGAMFSASLGCLVAATEFLSQKSPFLAEKRRIMTVCLAILAWFLSRYGFATLIGIVYPLCGYCGFAALVCVAEHYVKIHRERS